MSEPRSVAYAVGQFRDAAAEVDRLAQQSAILLDEERALEALGLPTSGRALDLGCGPGFVAARIRGARPHLQIVGVDRDPAVLARAREHIPAVEADAHRLPLPDASFDCVYVRFVLRHLAEPAVALAELDRVLRPGGRLIVIDSDDGALLLDPLPPVFARVWAARQQTFRRRGADPCIGRRLAGLLAAGGFGDLVSHPMVADTIGAGRQRFGRIVLAPIADAVDGDLVTRAEVDEAAAELAAWQDDPHAFGMTTVVALGGRKATGGA